LLGEINLTEKVTAAQSPLLHLIGAREPRSNSFLPGKVYPSEK
jgi:hypothetical protein